MIQAAVVVGGKLAYDEWRMVGADLFFAIAIDFNENSPWTNRLVVIEAWLRLSNKVDRQPWTP